MSKSLPFPPNGKTPGGVDVNIGPINTLPLDRFGAPLRKGAIVLFKPEVDMVMQVLDVSTGVDPRMPPGVVKVTLGCTPFTIGIQARQPQPRFVVIQALPDGPGEEPAPETQDEPVVKLS